MYRGNRDKAERDAGLIVNRLRAGESLYAMKAEYHCAYETLRKVVHGHIPSDELSRIFRRNLARRSGGPGRFKNGHVPWNTGPKGMHLSPATEFRRGCLRGMAARNWRPIGTVTIRHDKPVRRLRNRKRKPGMPPWPRKRRRYIKVADEGLSSRQWIPYARHVWRQANGPVPGDMRIIHLDGDTMNDSLDNLQAVPMRLLPKVARLLHPDLDEVRVRRLRKVRQSANGRVTAFRRQAEQARELISECPGCGYHAGAAPESCPKCGSHSFEEMRVGV